METKAIEYDFRTLLPGESVILTGDELVYLEIKPVSRKSSATGTRITADIENGLATMNIVNKNVLVDYWSPIKLANLGKLNGKITFASAFDPNLYIDTYLYMTVKLGYLKS